MTDTSNERLTEKPEDAPAPPPSLTPSPQEECKEYKDKYLRLLAESDNLRKRMQKEKQEAISFAVENLLAEILSPIDNFENALKMTEKLSQEMRTWAQGFLMILGQFKEVLGTHGVTSFHSEGELFDPHLHYAIETEIVSDKPVGTILQEFIKGYRNKDRVIRPAQVKVAAAPESENIKSGESAENPPSKI